MYNDEALEILKIEHQRISTEIDSLNFFRANKGNLSESFVQAEIARIQGIVVNGETALTEFNGEERP